MATGWVKLHREDLTNGILRQPLRYAFITYLRLKATHVACDVKIGHQIVHLEPGQLVFGRLQAAQDLAQSESQIRGHLNAIKASGYVSVKTTNKFSIITLLNWDIEQSGCTEATSKSSNKMPANRPQTRSKEKRNTPSSATGGYREGSESQQHPPGDFDQFWQAYPRKVAKAKARKVWDRLKPPLGKVLDALERQKKSSGWQKEDGRYIPYPAKWLEGEQWEDEQTKPKYSLDYLGKLS